MESQEADPERRVDPRGSLPLIGLVVVLGIIVVALFVFGPRGGQAETGSSTSTSPPTTAATTAPATTTLVPSTLGPVIDAEPVEPGAPVLGEEVGLTMWSGGDRPLGSIELDTGRIRQFEVRAFPVFAAGERIVVFDVLEREFGVFDPDNELLDPLPQDEQFRITSVAPTPDPDTVWAADASGEGQVEWRLISLRTMAPVRTSRTQTIITSELPFGIELAVGPELDIIGGEIHRLTPTGHEFWIDASIVVRDATSALIEQCNGDQCTRQWADIASGDVLDEPVPDLDERNEMLGGGGWVHSFAADLTSSEFVSRDGATTYDTGLLVSARRFDISPDGQWAAITGQQLLRMINLRTGEQIRVTEAAPILGTAATVVLTDS
jgi:hypothetical protein